MAIAKVYGQHVYKNETNGVTPQNQAAPNQQAGYTPGAEVTQAQNKLAAAENNKPAAYQQGSAVTQAQNQLNQLMAGKPQGYTSKYGSQLNSILEQIQNPDKFNWSFDGDELFKYYADLYSQNGKQASMDAMGQAAALTGGYGNSYAQQVGNQAYDEWMRNLYDKGMDLRDRAYQQYQDQRADLYNRYGVLQGADESEYGRYRDTVQDWNADRDYWTGRTDTESERDYNRYRDTVADYRDERDYLAGRYDTAADRDYNRYADERDYNRGVLESDRAYNEDVRRYDQDFSEDKRRYDQDYAEDVRRYDQDFAEDQRRDARDYAEDVRRYDQDYAENKRRYDQDFAEDQRRDERDYAEGVRRYDQDFAEDQRRDARDYAEDVRRYDQDYAEDVRRYNQDYAEDQRRYEQNFQEQVREFERQMDWENMSNDQKYASDLALQMLSMGLMPSEAMLRAAEISWADAQVLMNAYQQMLAAGGGSGGSNNQQTQQEVEQITSLPSIVGSQTDYIENQAAEAVPKATTPSGPVNTNVTVPSYNSVASNSNKKTSALDKSFINVLDEATNNLKRKGTYGATR